VGGGLNRAVTMKARPTILVMLPNHVEDTRILEDQAVKHKFNPSSYIVYSVVRTEGVGKSKRGTHTEKQGPANVGAITQESPVATALEKPGSKKGHQWKGRWSAKKNVEV